MLNAPYTILREENDELRQHIAVLERALKLACEWVVLDIGGEHPNAQQTMGILIAKAELEVKQDG
jgi:hypothetical protein